MIYIITCAKRFENLPQVKASLKPSPHCKWVTVFDEADAEIAPEGFGDIRLFCPESNVRHITREKNYALDTLPLKPEDWIYILDDDTIMHPAWYKFALPLMLSGRFSVLSWGSVRKNGKVFYPPVSTFKAYHVDTCNYAWRYGYKPALRYRNEPAEDGYLAEELGRPFVIRANLAYYNYLRP